MTVAEVNQKIRLARQCEEKLKRHVYTLANTCDKPFLDIIQEYIEILEKREVKE